MPRIVINPLDSERSSRTRLYNKCHELKINENDGDKRTDRFHKDCARCNHPATGNNFSLIDAYILKKYVQDGELFIIFTHHEVHVRIILMCTVQST